MYFIFSMSAALLFLSSSIVHQSAVQRFSHLNWMTRVRISHQLFVSVLSPDPGRIFEYLSHAVAHA